MKGEKVTVYLNGIKVTDEVTLENYWDRKQPFSLKNRLSYRRTAHMFLTGNIYPEAFAGRRNPSSQVKKSGRFYTFIQWKRFNGLGG
jgi:hypothetical protein